MVPDSGPWICLDAPPLTKYIPVLAPTLKNYILPWVAAAHSGGGERMGEGGAQNLRKYISHPSLTRYIFVAGRRPLSCFLGGTEGQKRQCTSSGTRKPAFRNRAETFETVVTVICSAGNVIFQGPSELPVLGSRDGV